MSNFRNIAYIQKQFHNLIRKMPSHGFLVFPEEDKNIEHLLELGVWSKRTKFGSV